LNVIDQGSHFFEKKLWEGEMCLREDYVTEASINEKMNVDNRNYKKYRFLAINTT